MKELIGKETFDFVFCFEVIEHVNDQRLFIDEISKVTNMGGHIFMSTINKTFLAKILLIDIAENFLGLVPKGTHSDELFIR